MVAFFSAALLAAGVAGTASAQTTVGDGLVNVAIGDVTILEDVQIVDAADIVVQACGLDVDATVGILAIIENIDIGGTKKATFCKVEEGQVKVTQNNND
jgi:hypothetical protein